MAEHLKLVDLWAGGTPITEAGVRSLAKMDSLVILELNGCQGVTDTAVAHLPHYKNLEVVFLAQTPITDAAIEYLIQVPELRHVDIRGTQITDEGRERLTAGLPPDAKIDSGHYEE